MATVLTSATRELLSQSATRAQSWRIGLRTLDGLCKVCEEISKVGFGLVLPIWTGTQDLGFGPNRSVPGGFTLTPGSESGLRIRSRAKSMQNFEVLHLNLKKLQRFETLQKRCSFFKLCT